MEKLGYYNGTYGPLDEMTVPIPGSGTEYMMPVRAGIIIFLHWMNTWTVFSEMQML